MQTNRSRSVILSLSLLVLLWTVMVSITTAQSSDAWQTYTKVSVINALVIEDNFVWAATDGGVLRWHSRDETYVKYTTADGLAHNEVRDVAIDPAGRKWFATAFGVSAFDGKTWITYTATNGLPHHDLRAVAIDPSGKVWAGTWGSGVSVFDGRRWTSYTTADGLAGNYILAIAIDEAGQKWFATATCRDGGCNGRGVTVFDGQTWTTYTTEDGLTSNWVEVIATDQAGQSWFGAQNGLSKFDGQTWDTTLRRDPIDALAVDALGNLWVGQIGEKGVSIFNGRRWRTHPVADGPSHLGSAIAVDDKGQVWVGSGSNTFGGRGNGGISLFDGQNWRTLPPAGPADNTINALATDQDGSIWLGSRAGLSQFADQSLQAESEPAAPDDQNSVWHSYPREGEFPANHISTLAIDQTGRVWAGGNEVSVFDGQTWRSYTTADGLLEGEVQAMVIDKVGRKWFALAGRPRQSGGVSVLADTTWTSYTMEDGLVSNHVLTLAIDDMDRKWFGTNAGVSVFDDQDWTTYTTADGLAHNWVNAIAAAADDHYWFGTEGGGVSLFDGQVWTTYTMADGLASNVIYALQVDQTGRIWAGTSGGVSVFSNGRWTTYTKRDGLVDNQVKAIAIDPTGHLWFGTEAGLSRFNERRWSATDPAIPLVKAVPVPAPPASLEMIGPRFIDDEAERIYTRGFVDGVEKTLVLALADERLLASYDLVGDLALDRSNGWLYVDQGSAGLAVVNTRTDRLHTIIFLPEQKRGLSVAPQADPVSGRVFAMRGNVAYLIDPQTGAIVDTLTTDITEIASCGSGPWAQVPAVHWSAIDDTARLLYLSSETFSCQQTTGSFSQSTLVSYQIDTGLKVDQGRSSYRPQVVKAGYLYETEWYRNAIWYEGLRSVWRDGRPWFSSNGWSDAGGQVDFDPSRRRFYEVTDSTLRVFEAETMTMILHLPRPITGTFERYDPATDQLQFRVEGQLRGWPAGNIQPPTPEPLEVSTVPTGPVQALALSPGWPQEATLFGIWDDPPQREPRSLRQCRAGNADPSLKIFISQNGGKTWGQPTAGLRSNCQYVTSLAVSPNYPRDQTLLLGVVGRGVFKSTDGGQSWLPSGAGLTTMRIDKILFAPGFAANQTAFARIAGLTDRGLYRSTDGGDTWQAFDTPSRILALSPEFDQDRTMMSSHYNHSSEQVELHLSGDGGDRWEVVGALPAGVSIQDLSLAPLFAKWRTLFAFTQQENKPALYRSSDGGRSWAVVLRPSADIQQLIYAPDIEENRPIFLLADETVYHSSDGGLTWQIFDLPLNVTPATLAISPNFAQDGLLFIGTVEGQVVRVEGFGPGSG